MSTEKMREVTVFEFMPYPRTILIPETLIAEFEKLVDPFKNMRATALLSTNGCNEHTYMNYSDEKMAEMLMAIMKEEIEIVPEMRSGIKEYIDAGMPESFSTKKK